MKVYLESCLTSKSDKKTRDQKFVINNKICKLKQICKSGLEIEQI